MLVYPYAGRLPPELFQEEFAFWTATDTQRRLEASELYNLGPLRLLQGFCYYLRQVTRPVRQPC